MGKKLTFFKSRNRKKWTRPSERAWNSEQKSILQQVSNSNSRRNTATLSSKFCQIYYGLDKIWRQSYSIWQNFELKVAVFLSEFEMENCCSILFCSEFHALSDGLVHFFRIRLLKNVNFWPIFRPYSFACKRQSLVHKKRT